MMKYTEKLIEINSYNLELVHTAIDSIVKDVTHTDNGNTSAANTLLALANMQYNSIQDELIFLNDL